MPFLTQGNTNWKFIAIVVVLAVVVGGGIWLLSGLEQEKSAMPEEELIEDIEKEIINWQTYRNKEYELDFNYPSNWGELTLESKRNNGYNFNSSNKEIIEIKYYEPREILAFITKGTIYREAKESVEKHVMLEEGVEVCDYILKVIYQDGEIKTVYTEENKPSEIAGKIVYPYAGGKKIGDIGFQPNEKYMKLAWSAYADYGSYLLNIDNGKDILAPYPIWNGDIYWSPDNKILAIKSYINEYGGEGTEGLFISDYNNPEKLNEVFSIPYKQYSKGVHINMVAFINSEYLAFEIGKELQKYTYNTKTKELKKIEETSDDLKQKAFLVCEEYELEHDYPDWDVEWKERFAQPGPVYPIAFTGPERKEFLGLCGPGGYAGYNMLFVLDEEKNIILQKGPELSAFTGTRYYNFEDVTIIDIDGDGIEEIVYKESTWSMRHMHNKTHLYSPKHEEWFYVGELEEEPTDFTTECVKTLVYSNNLEKEDFSTFKEFLKVEDPERCLYFGPG